MNYYNENNPFSAQALRNLIAAGAISNGVVDERSIEDVKPHELAGFKQCHFFAGIGVWSHALRLAGWPDDRPVWTGSCPCQPFSIIGEGGGFADERHLWPAWHWLITQRRPSVILGEQVASTDGLGWFDLVHADMEASDYAIGIADLCAASVGAPHIRQRLWFMGHAGEPRLEGHRGHGHCPTGRSVASGSVAPAGATRGHWNPADWLDCRDGKKRPVEPGTLPLAHGVADRMGRLHAYGNAIVAPLAAEFVITCMEYL